MKQHIITVAAVKGGTGKTTCVGCLAQCAALDHRRTLAVDLDPQANLSRWFRADMSSTAMIIFKGGDIRQAIQPTAAGVDLIAGHADLMTVTKTTAGSARRLATALEVIKNNYDFIIIDTPPAMGELMNNAVFAANELVVSLDTDICAIYGFEAILDIYARVKQSKPNLTVSGVFVDMYDRRGNVNADLRDIIEETAAQNGVPYLGEVRKSVKVREARAMREPLYDHSPKCSTAVDFKRIYDQIIRGRRHGRIHEEN